MIGAADLRSVAIFSGLKLEELQRLAKRAADVRLRSGDWLLREGERSGFFVLLEGEVQFTKDIFGQEVVVQAHGPGEFFGELPNLLGVLSGVSIRAKTNCRIARFELQQLQELIQDSAPSSQVILDKMIERVLLSQRYAKAAPTARAVMSGNVNGALAQRTKNFLAGNRIPYAWHIPPDDKTPMLQPSDDFTILVDGSRLLTNPNLRSLAEAFGFQTKPKRAAYDLIVVGAGPAGMAAGVYGASEGLSVLIVERSIAGGQAGTSSRIENYLGFPAGISGDDLSERALRQALRLGAEVALARSVTSIEREGDGYCVSLDEGERISSRAVLVATGVDWRRLDVPGLEELLGRGVLYGASKTEAIRVSGKRVFLVGGGNSAGQAAMFFSDYAEEVRVLVRGPGLAASMSQYLIDQLGTKPNITVEPYTHVAGVEGNHNLEQLVTVTSVPGREAKLRTRPADALYIMIGAHANTGWLPVELERDANGFLCTGRDVQGVAGARAPFPLETNVPGIFCAGDVRYGSIKRVASGVGEGSMAITFIHQYLALQPATSGR